MTKAYNPLSAYFRAPKLQVKIPSRGKFYSDDILEMPESGELPVMAMTAKDEVIMKNPDSLLNGESVVNLIKSCVPCVKNPRKLINNDVDVLLVAIQAATYGDDIEVKAKNPNDPDGEPVVGHVSATLALEIIEELEESVLVNTPGGLQIEIRPVTYDQTLKAGIASFKTSRALNGLSEVEDEMERIKVFSESFEQIAQLSFEMLVDSIYKITLPDGNVVEDRAFIREFLVNTDNSLGKKIQEGVESMNKIGLAKEMMFQPEVPEGENPDNEKYQSFIAPVSFDPVGFFTASLRELSQAK
jgi:hypothetical protein